jgi:hypothetical protein
MPNIEVISSEIHDFFGFEVAVAAAG